jgi:hypothetical protein
METKIRIKNPSNNSMQKLQDWLNSLDINGPQAYPWFKSWCWIPRRSVYSGNLVWGHCYERHVSVVSETTNEVSPVDGSVYRLVRYSTKSQVVSEEELVQIKLEEWDG